MQGIPVRESNECQQDVNHFSAHMDAAGGGG